MNSGASLLANVVGYVNAFPLQGYTFLENPLNHESGPQGNNLTNVISSPPDGTRVYLWDVTNQVFSPPATFAGTALGWDRDFDLQPGRGFVIYSPQNWTNTFVGNVLQGALTNFIAGSNKLSLLGSKVPQSGPISLLAFPGIEGANVYLFNSASQKYTDAFTFFSGSGWFDPTGTFDAQGPAIKLAESFFVQNPGSNTNWIRTFFVQVVSPPSKSIASATSQTTPEIQALVLTPRSVTLRISKPTAAFYHVEFSTDRVSWKRIAANQTGSVWTGPAPGGSQGYYRLTTP